MFYSGNSILCKVCLLCFWLFISFLSLTLRRERASHTRTDWITISWDTILLEKLIVAFYRTAGPPILNLWNRANFLPHTFFKIIVSVTLPFALGCDEWPFAFRLSFLTFPRFLGKYHSPCFDQANDIWWTIQICVIFFILFFHLFRSNLHLSALFSDTSTLSFGRVRAQFWHLYKGADETSL
jgi:hypothetical protein